ncbi:MAG: hypothetical protein QXK89_01690 [Candidatus Bathyarchaeia archaeon]|nr:hypothetical protein [Candidatus Bathyarchaeota archaeon]
MDIKEAKSLSRDLKTIGRVFNDIADVASNINNTTKPLKRLINIKNGSWSSKLITAGIACVAFPEPVFSDILGCTLITTGIIINKSKEPTIIDVFRETRKIGTDLKRLNKDLNF